MIIERLTYEVCIEEIETKGIRNILRIMRGTEETIIIMRLVANDSDTQSYGTKGHNYLNKAKRIIKYTRRIIKYLFFNV